MSLSFASSSICVLLFTCNSCLQLIPCLCHPLLVHQYKVHETLISVIHHFHKKCSNYQRICRTCWWDALHLPGLPPRLARLLSMSVLLTHKVNTWDLKFFENNKHMCLTGRVSFTRVISHFCVTSLGIKQSTQRKTVKSITQYINTTIYCKVFVIIIWHKTVYMLL